MRIALLVLLLAVYGLCNGQPVKEVNTLTKEEYLQKSKNQKVAYLVTGSAGLLLMIVGGVVSLSEIGEGITLMGSPSGYNKKKISTGEALFYTGLGLGAISIPINIASHKNKKRAAALSINSNYRLFQNQKGITARRMPALSVTISL